MRNERYRVAVSLPRPVLSRSALCEVLKTSGVRAEDGNEEALLLWRGDDGNHHRAYAKRRRRNRRRFSLRPRRGGGRRCARQSTRRAGLRQATGRRDRKPGRRRLVSGENKELVRRESGELFGIPPTGREFAMTGIVIHRIAGRKDRRALARERLPRRDGPARRRPAAGRCGAVLGLPCRAALAELA